MIVKGPGLNEQSLEDLPQTLPTQFGFMWLSSFRGEICLEIDQSETQIVCSAMFAMGS